MTTAADEAFQGVAPLLQAMQGEDRHLDPAEATKLFVKAKPALLQAKSSLDEAMTARSEIDVQYLDPKVRTLIVDKLDPYLGLFHDGLVIAVVFPKLAGVANYGPQTYLLLLQNEDELRATGGFITSAGTFVVKDGNILNFVIEDSYAFDDPTILYPSAPWQLHQYMELPTVLLRDANWSPDFPTSAALAEYLYALTRFHGADGVVAIDQYAVKSLLTVLGPVQVEAVSYPITTENVVMYMRQAKGQAESSGENRKSFMNELGGAILEKIKTSKDIDWLSLLKVLQADLNAHHVLLQFDDSGMAAVLAERGWDGALRPGVGDFLMVVDSNVGFNKVNAVVEANLSYDVDLSNPAAPSGLLTVVHMNNAAKGVPCVQFDMDYQGSYDNLINRCYWDYLRVYKPLGAQLLEATPRAVPSAAIVMLNVAFMSVNQVVWAANPAQGTGGAGSTHLDGWPWFAEFPNDALPQGTIAILDNLPVTTPDVPSYPDTGHSLHLVSEAFLDTSSPAGMHLVCYPTPPSGGAIFWLDPTLNTWVPLANFQVYPTWSGVPYTCVNTWLTGTFGFGYIVP